MPNYRNNLVIYHIYPPIPLFGCALILLLVATAVDMYETICKKLSNITLFYL